jgi:hypothetical protein
MSQLCLRQRILGRRQKSASHPTGHEHWEAPEETLRPIVKCRQRLSICMIVVSGGRRIARTLQPS